MPIHFHRKGGELQLTWSPSPAGDEALTPFFLREQLEKQSFLDYYVLEEALQQLFYDYTRYPQQTLTAIIAEQRNSTYEVQVEPDKFSAYVTVTESFGGKKPRLEDMIAILKEQRITYGVIPTALDQVLNQGYAAHLLIARGDPPENGKDATFEPLVWEPEEQGKPRILANQQADFHDLQLITTVEQGVPLMKKIPAGKGKTGFNVFGEPIPQKKGKDRPFGVGKGSTVSQVDPHILIAATAGQVKVHSNFVSVEPVFHISSIDYSSGNIYFPGTVMVDNDVSMHFKIAASGDIFVSGTVEAAELYSGSEISVYGGIVGNRQAKIHAGSHIRAKFVENSQMQAIGSIHISDLLMYSQVTAYKDLEVGTFGSKGQIVGGITRAGHLLKAKILGSPSNTQTYVEVGRDPELNQKLTAVQQKLHYYKSRLDELLKAIIHVKVNQLHEDFTCALENLRERLLIKVHELTEKEGILEKAQSETPYGKIIVTEQIYAGVIVRMGEYTRTFHSNFPGSTLYIDSEKKEIAIGS